MLIFSAVTFLLILQKHLSEHLLRSSEPSTISEGKPGRSPSLGPQLLPTYSRAIAHRPPRPVAPAPAVSRHGRWEGGSDGDTGRDPLQPPSREEAPPARPRCPLSPRAARAAGPWLPRQPHANGRGAGRSRYRLRRAPLPPIREEEREKGRGFSCARAATMPARRRAGRPSWPPC